MLAIDPLSACKLDTLLPRTTLLPQDVFSTEYQEMYTRKSRATSRDY